MINLSAEIIANGVTYEIRNLSSIEFSGQDRSDTTLPSWGIQSNSGSLEFNDADGEILALHKNGYIVNSKIFIYLNIGNREKQIGSFSISDIKKQTPSFQTTLEFSDVLTSWQNITMPKYYYPYADKDIYAKDIIDTLCERSGVELKYSDEATRTRLSNLRVFIPLLESGSLWSQMTKICELGACYIYCDNEGVPNIHYSGGT
jgi:hypothetical protein